MLIAMASLISVPSGGVSAHEFPDDYIDRTISVVLRDRRVRIEYSIGMNDLTMQKLLDEWSRLDETAAAKEDSRPDSNSDSAGNPTSIQPKKPMPRLGDRRQQVPDSEFKSNDQELLDRFQKRAIQMIPGSFEVYFNDAPLSPAKSWKILPTRRHMSLTMELELEITEATPAVFRVLDQNFQSLAGGIRKSIKASGNSLLASSNSAPILVRANRIERADVKEADWQKANELIAKVVQLSKGRD